MSRPSAGLSRHSRGLLFERSERGARSDASIHDLVLSIDAHEAAKAMVKSLDLDAQVQTMVGRWEEDGQLTGWVKRSGRSKCSILVEVFISDIDGETREFDRYARQMKSLIEENKRLREHLAEQIQQVRRRIEDGTSMGASIWRIALEAVARENVALLESLTDG